MKPNLPKKEKADIWLNIFLVSCSIPFLGLLMTFGIIPAGSIPISAVTAKTIILIGIISFLIYHFLLWKKYNYPPYKYIILLLIGFIFAEAFSILASFYPSLKPIDYPPLGFIRGSIMVIIVYIFIFYKPRGDS